MEHRPSETTSGQVTLSVDRKIFPAVTLLPKNMLYEVFIFGINDKLLPKGLIKTESNTISTEPVFCKCMFEFNQLHLNTSSIFFLERRAEMRKCVIYGPYNLIKHKAHVNTKLSKRKTQHPKRILPSYEINLQKFLQL